MECKFVLIPTIPALSFGINRYIMECKCVIFCRRSSACPELIDTLWNVNRIWRSRKIPLCGELIDTLWNVNSVGVGKCGNRKQELIDTLWNVNLIPLKVSFVLTSELIDTLWNVNENIKRIFLLDVLELIDTLWNVNIKDTLFLCDILRINRYIMECKFNRIGIRINP